MKYPRSEALSLGILALSLVARAARPVLTNGRKPISSRASPISRSRVPTRTSASRRGSRTPSQPKWSLPVTKIGEGGIRVEEHQTAGLINCTIRITYSASISAPTASTSSSRCRAGAMSTCARRRQNRHCGLKGAMDLHTGDGSEKSRQRGRRFCSTSTGDGHINASGPF